MAHGNYLQKGLLQLYLFGLIPAGNKQGYLLLLRKDAAMVQKDNDLQKIQELIEIMKRNGLVEVEIEHGNDKIHLRRPHPQSGQSQIAAGPTVGPEILAASSGAGAAEAPSAEQKLSPSQLQPEEDLVEIKSPIVGTFYVAPSPDSAPFVEIDSAVGPQTVVCTIEAMKVMNEIKAETSGTIAAILVTNGQAVEYGQVLFKVKPD